MPTAWNERTLARILALEPRLRRLASRLSRDAHEADDLVQDVWIAVLTQWPGESCELEPWARQVLRNAARKRARRAPALEWDEQLASDRSIAGADGYGADGSSLDGLAREERASRLRASIEALPDPYRRTLIEHFYAARSVGEIAAGQGIPRATVSTQLRRALARLRARLGRRRDLLALALPWRSADRTARSRRVLPRGSAASGASTGLASRLGLSLGAAALVAAIPFAFALAAGRGEGIGAPIEPIAVAHRVPAASGEHELALDQRRSAPEAEHAARTLAVEARAERDGTPLSDGRVTVWDESGVAHVARLDRDGRAQVPVDPEARLLLVEVARAEDDGGFRRFAIPEGGRLELRAGKGPLVRFVLSGAENTHPSALRFGARSAVAGSLASPRLAIGPGEAAGEFRAQLPEAFADLTGYQGMELCAVSDDGLLAAEAAIDGPALSEGRTLELALEPRAALDLDLALAAGESFAMSVVHIAPLGDSRARIAASDPAGRVFVGGLRPGGYRVSVEVAGRAPWFRELELAAGKSEQLVAEARAAECAQRGPIRGRIRRDASDYDGAMIVLLEGGRVPQYTRAKWVEIAGGFEARFEFPAGDAGDLIVRPIALDGLPSFFPPTISFHGGAEAVGELAFVCRGRRSNPSIACDVRAADTLESLLGATLEFELAGGTTVFHNALDAGQDGSQRWAVSSRDLRWKVREGSPFDWLDEGSEVRWRLTAPGFLALEGDQSAWSTGTFVARPERAPLAR